MLYLCMTVPMLLSAGIQNLSLPHALEILKTSNLELKISRFNEQIKTYEAKVAEGYHYGKLDAKVIGMRSNDSGNVFGFKLQSREATFGDFGFAEFDMSGKSNPLPVAPTELNYPEARNHYQTKLSYMLPLYTGGKLTEYTHITNAMVRMSQYDTKKLLNEKVYQTKKSFYDISLLNHYIYNLSKIMRNIKHLEDVVKTMVKEGYAQNIDILEVKARKAEASSMYNQAKLNRKLAYQFLSFLLNEEVKSIHHKSTLAPMPHVNVEKLEENIDIQKAVLGLQIAQMAYNVEKANFLPSLGAFAEYGSANDVLWKDFIDKDAYSIGVQVEWNLFNGGIDHANLERAKVNTMMVEDQVKLAKSGIALQVKKLQTEIFSADSDIKNFNQQLKFARKVYQNYKTRYKEGLVSISDLLIKQSKELEVLLKLLTVKNKRNTKIFELNSLLNTGGNV